MPDDVMPEADALENPASEKREPPEKEKRLATFVALLLTFSAIFTLLSSWEDTSVTGSNYEIITTEFNRTQATLLSQSKALQNYTIYSYYLTNQTLNDGLNTAIETAGDDSATDAMRVAQEQSSYLAPYNRYFSPGNYLRLFQRNSRSHSERGNTNKPFLDRRP